MTPQELRQLEIFIHTCNKQFARVEPALSIVGKMLIDLNAKMAQCEEVGKCCLAAEAELRVRRRLLG